MQKTLKSQQKNKTSLPDHLIVFDGQCALCNRFVQYILRKDVKEIFYFSSFQGLTTDVDQSKMETPLYQSVAYFKQQVCSQKSTAVIKIYKTLFGPFHWSQLGWIIPRFIRDGAYDIVAKYRYRWFGKYERCMIPTKDQEKRFIG